MKRIAIFIGVPHYEALQRLAMEEGITMAEVIRRAIAFFLKAAKES